MVKHYLRQRKLIDMKYDRIDSALFIENRERFCAKIKPNSIAIFHSNDQMPRSGDTEFRFRQNADLFYLSGVDQEETILFLYPECPNPKLREVLFVRETNEYLAVWEGDKLTTEQATEVSGISVVKWNDEFSNLLEQMMPHATNVYLNLNENDRAHQTVTDRSKRFALEMQQRFPLHNYERSAPELVKLRSRKHPVEVELIQKSINITEKAFRRVLEFVKPGVMEFEVEAEIIHEFIRNRASGHAYDPIIASGANACVLHYITNDMECKDGDLLLMDFGSEYANYAADLSRTIPVNGRFTDRQKAVYNSCLKVMKRATEMLVPGILLEEYHKEVGKAMESELIGLGLLDKTEVDNQDPEKPLFKKYFPHGTSHFMGIDVHDLGCRYRPIRASSVFTCEPGIYIREENIGVRIENDILVTENGPVDLMASIPREVEEIEDLMNE